MCSVKINTKGGGSYITLICHPLLFLSDYFLMCLMCYLMIPFCAIVMGFKKAWTGSIDPQESVFSLLPKLSSAKFLPIFLLYEYFLEALPQLILSIVFLNRIDDFLLVYDTIFGVPLPISLISCIFSGGSLLIGIFLSYRAFIHFNEFDDDDD